MVDLATIVGLLAAFLLAIRVSPQVIKGYVTKKVHDVSFGWIAVGMIGSLMWIFYAILIGDWIIIAGNVVGVTAYCMLIHQKHIYDDFL